MYFYEGTHVDFAFSQGDIADTIFKLGYCAFGRVWTKAYFDELLYISNVGVGGAGLTKCSSSEREGLSVSFAERTVKRSW